MRFERSQALLERALAHMPGGVNSPVRAYRAVGGTPPFIRRAAGARVYDEDGNEFIDYLGSWGPMLLGHAHPEVVEAVTRAAVDGMSFGASTEREVLLAERVAELVPSVEKIRMVNSGTEATMSAVRLARGVTGRDLLIKFEGGYHGHGDSFLIRAGSGVATLGLPDSPGVTAGTAAGTLTAPYNDLAAVKDLFDARGREVAAVIVEPVAGNMGCVPPVTGFLDGLRELCTSHGALLIFDEVMTGFRVARGGAAERYGIAPDLFTFGKVIGGGLPVGAFGGRGALMDAVAPDGPVYQAGTLAGNPLAMAAGLATLDIIAREEDLFDRREDLGRKLVLGLEAAAEAAGVATTSNRVGSMFTSFMTGRPVRDLASAKTCDKGRFTRFFHLMLERGVALAPSQFESGFVSAAHTEEDVAATVAAARESFARL